MYNCVIILNQVETTSKKVYNPYNSNHSAKLHTAHRIL